MQLIDFTVSHDQKTISFKIQQKNSFLLISLKIFNLLSHERDDSSTLQQIISLIKLLKQKDANLSQIYDQIFNTIHYLQFIQQQSIKDKLFVLLFLSAAANKGLANHFIELQSQKELLSKWKISVFDQEFQFEDFQLYFQQLESKILDVEVFDCRLLLNNEDFDKLLQFKLQFQEIFQNQQVVLNCLDFGGVQQSVCQLLPDIMQLKKLLIYFHSQLRNNQFQDNFMFFMELADTVKTFEILDSIVKQVNYYQDLNYNQYYLKLIVSYYFCGNPSLLSQFLAFCAGLLDNEVKSYSITYSFLLNSQLCNSIFCSNFAFQLQYMQNKILVYHDYFKLMNTMLQDNLIILNGDLRQGHQTIQFQLFKLFKNYQDQNNPFLLIIVLVYLSNLFQLSFSKQISCFKFLLNDRVKGMQTNCSLTCVNIKCLLLLIQAQDLKFIADIKFINQNAEKFFDQTHFLFDSQNNKYLSRQINSIMTSINSQDINMLVSLSDEQIEDVIIQSVVYQQFLEIAQFKDLNVDIIEGTILSKIDQNVSKYTRLLTLDTAFCKVFIQEVNQLFKIEQTKMQVLIEYEPQYSEQIPQLVVSFVDKLRLLTLSDQISQDDIEILSIQLQTIQATGSDSSIFQILKQNVKEQTFPNLFYCFRVIQEDQQQLEEFNVLLLQRNLLKQFMEFIKTVRLQLLRFYDYDSWLVNPYIICFLLKQFTDLELSKINIKQNSTGVSMTPSLVCQTPKAKDTNQGQRFFQQFPSAVVPQKSAVPNTPSTNLTTASLILPKSGLLSQTNQYHQSSDSELIITQNANEVKKEQNSHNAQLIQNLITSPFSMCDVHKRNQSSVIRKSSIDITLIDEAQNLAKIQYDQPISHGFSESSKENSTNIIDNELLTKQQEIQCGQVQKFTAQKTSGNYGIRKQSIFNYKLTSDLKNQSPFINFSFLNKQSQFQFEEREVFHTGGLSTIYQSNQSQYEINNEQQAQFIVDELQLLEEVGDINRLIPNMLPAVSNASELETIQDNKMQQSGQENVKNIEIYCNAQDSHFVPFFSMNSDINIVTIASLQFSKICYYCGLQTDNLLTEISEAEISQDVDLFVDQQPIFDYYSGHIVCPSCGNQRRGFRNPIPQVQENSYFTVSAISIFELSCSFYKPQFTDCNDQKLLSYISMRDQLTRHIKMIKNNHCQVINKITKQFSYFTLENVIGLEKQYSPFELSFLLYDMQTQVNPLYFYSNYINQLQVTNAKLFKKARADQSLILKLLLLSPAHQNAHSQPGSRFYHPVIGALHNILKFLYFHVQKCADCSKQFSCCPNCSRPIEAFKWNLVTAMELVCNSNSSLKICPKCLRVCHAACAKRQEMCEKCRLHRPHDADI